MQVKIPIKKRNRDYGLFSWRLEDDFEVKTLFGKEPFILLRLDGKEKQKKVDYKHRRFSIGKRAMAAHRNADFFILLKKDNAIELRFE